jgi:hypothetical protein
MRAHTGLWLCCIALPALSIDAQTIRTNSGFKTNVIPRNDDGSGPLTPLGFTINLFGKVRDSAYVNNNGNITFDSDLATYTPFGLQSTSREIIAAFFADVDTRGTLSREVTYGQDTVNGHAAFGANYIDVGYYESHDDKLNRFQLVLIDRSDTGPGNLNIEFNYERMLWETGDASGGSKGVASDYFARDATIRFGGAFALQFTADAAFTPAAAPFNVRLSNTEGWSPVAAAHKCP